MTIPNLEIFLFCQYNSTRGGNLKLRQTIVPKFEKIVKFFSRVRASMAVIVLRIKIKDIFSFFTVNKVG
jgi:hypothetical protein